MVVKLKSCIKYPIDVAKVLSLIQDLMFTTRSIYSFQQHFHLLIGNQATVEQHLNDYFICLHVDFTRIKRIVSKRE